MHSNSKYPDDFDVEEYHARPGKRYAYRDYYDMVKAVPRDFSINLMEAFRRNMVSDIVGSFFVVAG